MARRRKKSSGSNKFLGGLILLVLIVSAVPKEGWITIGVLAGIALVIYFGLLFSSSKTIPSVSERTNPPPSNTANSSTRRAASSRVNVEVRYGTGSDPVPITKPAPSRATSGFGIPKAPKGFGAAKWIPAGESIAVAGTAVPGGMLYVGTSLTTPSGETDPCLIDPSRSVSAHGDYTEREMGYWPNYSEISSRARRAYLSWLEGGRRDPEADLGYIFLFFYGLERRVLVDAQSDPAAKSDLPLIATELRRLLGIYSERSGSLRHYAGELLNWIELIDHGNDLYEKPIPELPNTSELSIYLRLALGQAAIAGIPIPPELALTWVKHDPAISLRTPAARCAEQFDILFHQRYIDVFGAGLKLPRNRTKLKFVYRPASAGFFSREIKRTFGEVPDVTAVTGPTKKLQKIVDEATETLASYSRLVGKTPEAADTLEGCLLLPMILWPEAVRAPIETLKTRMGGGMLLFTYETLLTELCAQSTLTRAKTQELARILASINIGFEPDVLSGARTPKPESKIVLFDLPPEETQSQVTTEYQAALLTLQLASAVAAADGEFSAKEINHLRTQVESWSHLTHSHHRRLIAHLRLLIAEPMAIGALKKKLDPLRQSEKESIASFMAVVAQSDGVVSPEEVKLLEKLYKALGIQSKKVFSDLHAVSAGETPATDESEQNGFTLDPTRIAALQQDTQKVSALLSSIFTETDDTSPVEDGEEESGSTENMESVAEGILGLDEAHSAFARLLISRPQWSREDLEDAAADLELMLDGALEQLNEVAYDTHDIPFTEGDDPIEVGAEIVEMIAA
ncbi:TerB N-terminal domain-containing protein [Microbulbifer rhizosphaerae]|uniref:Tellurite resistance protein n=1 Tax=Microbulbifer rhizosphaerae TaxID=1562603 RepID=A0A7W4W9E3_9GAMM|nr:TerB N-terminal domain-containing protein [Microbulbifer rhizosphaerae]MBB3060076.1 tellurite resistance protein [Microbulbifer rhizosphaerae]